MKKIVVLTVLLAGAIGVFGLPRGHADEVVLKNGRSFKGKVLYDAMGEIKFRHENGTESRWPKSDVARVTIDRSKAEEAAALLAQLKGEAAAIVKISMFTETEKRERREEIARRLVTLIEEWRTDPQTLPVALEAVAIALEIAPDIKGGRELAASLKEQRTLDDEKNAEPPQNLPELITRTSRIKLIPALRGPSGSGLVREYHAIGDTHARAIERGVRWLTDNQEPDGLWDIQKHGGVLGKSATVTGACVLALLGSGMSPEGTDEKSERLAMAIEWISRWQDKNGNFPDGDMIHHNFGNMMAATALLDAVAMGARSYKPQAELALKWVLKNQLPDGGFSYNQEADPLIAMRSGNTNVTRLSLLGFQCIAAAMQADIVRGPEPEYVRKTGLYFSSVTTADTAARTIRVFDTYNFRQPPGENSEASDTSLAARLFFYAAFKNELAKSGLAVPENIVDNRESLLASKTLALPEKRGAFPMYALFLAAFADGKETYRRAREEFLEPILAGQLPDGSWDPGKLDGDRNGGKVWVTAMYVLALEVPWLFPTIRAEGLN